MPKSQETSIIRGEAAKAFEKLGLPSLAGAKHLVRSQSQNDNKGQHYIPKESVKYVPRSPTSSAKPSPAPTTESLSPAARAQPASPAHSPHHERRAEPPNTEHDDVKVAGSETPAFSASAPVAMSGGGGHSALTVEALLDALDKAREKGYQDGFALGQQEGKTAGIVEGQKQGFEEGYQKGIQEGQQAGRQAIQGELQQIEQQLASVLDGLFQPLAEQDEQLTKALVDMVMQIARNVIHRELHADSSQITTLVKEAMRMLPAGGQSIRVYLHPQDLGYIRDLQQQLQATWQLLPDEQLLPGGCRVETSHSIVDASVASRLAHYVDALAEQHLHVHAVSLEQMHHQAPSGKVPSAASSSTESAKPTTSEQVQTSAPDKTNSASANKGSLDDSQTFGAD